MNIFPVISSHTHLNLQTILFHSLWTHQRSMKMRLDLAVTNISDAIIIWSCFFWYLLDSIFLAIGQRPAYQAYSKIWNFAFLLLSFFSSCSYCMLAGFASLLYENFIFHSMKNLMPLSFFAKCNWALHPWSLLNFSHCSRVPQWDALYFVASLLFLVI